MKRLGSNQTLHEALVLSVSSKKKCDERKREEPYLHLISIQRPFSVCRVKRLTSDLLNAEYCFTAKTEEELSLLCPTSCVPLDCEAREDGFWGLKIEGILDFSLIGILAELTEILAKEKVGVFVVSTYNTDYIFLKQSEFERAANALRRAGHTVGS